MAPAPIHIDAPRVNRGGQLTDEQRAAYVARYDAEIRYMDRHLGRLLAALRSLERYDASLIIVTSDHGETFGEHGLMEHGRWLYEEVLRVPLIVHFPGGKGAGTSVDAPVSLVDLLPLIAAEVGLELPDEVEGVPVGERELVLAESFRDALAIRAWGERFDRDLVAAVRWPWKLILSDTGEAELYQLDRDLGELRNRAGEEEEGAELGRALARAHAALRAPGKNSPAEASGRLREQLRALGYID